MDDTQVIAEQAPPARASTVCPICGEKWFPAEPLVSELLGARQIRRCGRCCGRFTVGEGDALRVANCANCALPFLSPTLHPDAPAQCSDCENGRAPDELNDPEVAAAAEEQIRGSIRDAWCPVGSEDLSRYLDGVATRVAGKIEGAPARARVVMFEDGAWRTLALPSGAVLMSVGLLAALEDEAELAFVLGHELTHAVGDASAGLVRIGLSRLTGANRGGERAAWARTARDILELGYGDDRERIADLTSLRAMLALGYDPEAAARFLARLSERARRGDAEVRDQVIAHPPPDDRRRRLEKATVDHSGPGTAGRVNREVFRRAAGYSVLSTNLAPLTTFLEQPGATARRPARWPAATPPAAEAKKPPRVRPALGIGFLTVLLALLWYVVLS